MARPRLFRPVPGLPDRAVLLATIGRYTRFVRVSKLTLMLLIIVLLGAVVILPLLRGDTSGVRIAFAPTQEVPDATPIMKNPRFQGTDDQEQPYMVTAESAIQQDTDTILLKRVQADMTLKDSAWLSVKANEGILKLSEEKLYLLGKVELFHEKGYEVRTERVGLSMASGVARGDTPLEGQAAIGYIKAKSFTAYDRGKRFVFDGPVQVVIHRKGK